MRLMARLAGHRPEQRGSVGQNETRDDRRAQERADITARIARFKSTQDKFAREREEYASRAWRKAHRGEAAE